MKRSYILLLFIFNVYSGFSQSAGQIQNGVYSGFQKNRQTGIFLFNPDSTFLFCGVTQLNKYIIANGTWHEAKDKDSLYLTYSSSEIQNSDIFFYDSPVFYYAETRPSFDSIYFEIEVQDSLAKSVGCQIQFSNRLITNTNQKGKLKIVLPVDSHNSITKLTFLEGNKYLHIPDGSFYNTEVILAPNRNFHKIKVARQKKEKIPFSLLEKERSDTLYNTKVISDTEILYNSSYFGLKKINNKTTITDYFKNVKKTYPSFKYYIEKAEIKFTEYFKK